MRIYSGASGALAAVVANRWALVGCIEFELARPRAREGDQGLEVTLGLRDDRGAR